MNRISIRDALGIDLSDSEVVKTFEKRSGVSIAKLDTYDKANAMPTESELQAMCEALGMPRPRLLMRMGIFTEDISAAIARHADNVYALIEADLAQDKQEDSVPAMPVPEKTLPKEITRTALGTLYQGDCLALMERMDDQSVDLIFADPPFNLSKQYPSGISDDLAAGDYLAWCERWCRECVRILKSGGSLFIWNLPKWNTHLAEYLKTFLTFRDWITVDIKYGLPISNRLYPSHYSLIYFCKGKTPRVFHPDRLPIQVCPACFKELKDYGGYKDKMNPSGVNLTDVWLDIPPVRHAKHKKRTVGYELSIRLLDRVIEMASNEGDLVFDPFGGAGTTCVVSEIKARRWLGIEIGPVEDIQRRLESVADEAETLSTLRHQYNHLFPDETLKARRQKGLWTPDSVRQPKLIPS